MQPQFAASNTSALVAKLKSSAATSTQLAKYRALFDEFEANADVSHSRSILSPAAYFTDLMRMVLTKEAPALGDSHHKRKLPEAKRLIKRRPDLMNIPLDAEHTNEESPYLEWVNKILAARLAVLYGRQHWDPAQGLAEGDLVPFAADRPAHQVSEAMRLVSLRPSDVLQHLPGVHGEPICADLGMDPTSFAAIYDRAFFRKKLRKLDLEGAIKDALLLPQEKDGTKTRLRDFLPRLGIDEAVVDELTSPVAGTRALSALISEAVSSGARDDHKVIVRSRRYVMVENDEGLHIAYFADYEDARQVKPSEPTRIENRQGTSMEPDRLAECVAVLAELARICQLAKALGWPVNKLIHFAQAIVSTESSVAYFGYDSLSVLLYADKVEKRFDLDLSDLELLLCFKADILTPDLNGDPGFYERNFPWPWGDRRYGGAFTVAGIPAWLGSASGLSIDDVRLIFGYLETRKARQANEATDPASIQARSIAGHGYVMMIPCRYKLLSRILGRSVEEIVGIQDVLDIGFDNWKDIEALIEASDQMKDMDLAVPVIRAMLQQCETSSCTNGLLQAASSAIRDALGSDGEAESPDDELEDLHVVQGNAGDEIPEELNWETQHAIMTSLAALYGVDYQMFDLLMERSMEYERRDPLLRQLMSDAWSNFNAGDLALSSPETIAFSNLQAGLMFVTQLKLEFKDIPTWREQEILGIQSGELNAWRHWDALKRFHAVKKLEEDTGENVVALQSTFEVQLFDQSRSTAPADIAAFEQGFLDRFSTLTGLSAEDLSELWVNREDGIPFTDDAYQNPFLDEVLRLSALAKVGKKLGLKYSDMAEILRLYNQELSLSGARSVYDTWAKRKAVADTVMAGVQSRIRGGDWRQSRLKIDARTLELERDALAQGLIWALNSQFTEDAGKYPDPVSNFQDLSTMLLVDIEMGGTALISELKLALNTMQTYLQRVLTNQESPRPFILDKAEWTWRAHYRLWEANRKVFLFPENYLDPGLRRKKTPQFRELEDTLLQSEIDDESVTDAYLAYLEKLEALSNLDVVSTCVASRKAPGSSETRPHLFLLGRSRAAAPVYYLRYCRVDPVTFEPAEWGPWEKIKLPVHAPNMFCTFINNRVHVFWADSEETATVHGDARQRNTFVTIRYSYQTVSGGWLEPQIFDGMENVLAGTLNQAKKDADWKFKPALSDKEDVFYPKNKPALHAKLIAEGTDLKATGRHPRVTLRFKVNDDLVLGGIGNGALGHFAAPGDWAVYFWGDGGWKANPDTNEAFGSKENHLEVTSLIATNDNSAYLAIVNPMDGNYSQIVRSTDAGRTWNDATIGIPEPDVKHSYDREKKLPTSLYSARTNGAIYAVGGSFPPVLFRSDDYGLQWKELSVHPEMSQFHDLTVSPDGQSLFMIGYRSRDSQKYKNEGALFVSKDGGQSWEKSLSIYAATDPGRRSQVLKHICFDPTCDRILAYAEDGHFYMSDDHATTWSDATIPQSYALHGMVADPVNGGIVLGRRKALHGESSVVRTMDGGSSYTEIGGTYPGDLQSVHLMDGAIIGVNKDSLNIVRFDTGKWLEYSDLLNVVKGSGFYSRFRLCASGGHMGPVMAHSNQGFFNKLPCRSHTIVNGDLDTGPISALGWFTTPTTQGKYAALKTQAANALGQKLIRDGLDSMLSLSSQQEKIDQNAVGKPCRIDFSAMSGFSQYYRELFFHVPYLLGDTLNKNRKFKDAKTWYNYVFRPSLLGEDNVDNDPMPFWRYRIFREYDLRHLESFDAEELALYEDDPFDAHAIAAIRLGAYEKAIVMRYIDNLLDWADELFRQENWESLTEAMALYVQASDLLGPRPERAASSKETEDPQTLAKLEEAGKLTGATTDSFIFSDRESFPIPANHHFEGYWDRTEDRITKIRLSEDIRGAKRQLSLFQPPIDPRQIMAALASGMTLDQAYQTLSDAPPRHRFGGLFSRAKDVAGTVVEFGNALLSALERKDAEGLAHLRQSQEAHILDMVTELRSNAVEQAELRKTALSDRKQHAKDQYDHFDKLISKGLLSSEDRSLKLKSDALDIQAATASIRSASIAGYLFPNIFGMAEGGQRFGQAIEIGAGVLDSSANQLNQSASLKDQRAQNDRRKAEWQWQRDQASAEVSRLQTQIEIAELAVAHASQELTRHNEEMNQHQALQTYAENKFTNRELYGWMVGKLSSLYMAAFNLALEFASDAQEAYWFERACQDHIITAAPIRSLTGALLSGRDLQLALARLEKSYYDKAEAEIEVEKTISLKYMGQDSDLGGICDDWTQINKSGRVSFKITEAFLSQDRLGDGYRRIHSIELTLPAMVRPYQNIHATLTQVSHTGPMGNTLPANGEGQRVAISKAVNDAGVFELNFNSERYMPFEGTGAVSTWRLDIPKDLSEEFLEHLSDVIVHIKYKVMPT